MMADDMSGIPIGTLAQLGIKIIDYFQNKRERRDAIENIEREWVGEVISRPLVEMHSALVRADTISNMHSNLLQAASGNFKDILVQNLSIDFINQAQQHLKVFWDNVHQLENTSDGGSEVMESVKGNACASKDRFATELKQKLEYFTSIGQAGGRPAPLDIRDVTTALHNFIDCYIIGVSAAIEDLAHAGRKKKVKIEVKNKSLWHKITHPFQ